MARSCLIHGAIAGLVVLLVCGLPWADEPLSASGKLARLISNQAAPDSREAAVEEWILPKWLDDLLTHVPASDQGDDHLKAAPQDDNRDVPDQPPAAAGPVGQYSVEEVEAELEQTLAAVGSGPQQAQPDVEPLLEDSGFAAPPPIAPLYSSPPLEGEGVWTGEDLPADAQGKPLVYRTVYRPSVEFPNSVVYMAVFDMKRIKLRFFIGNTEPGIYQISEPRHNERLSRIIAITNAMWMQQHARGAGAIFRSQVVYPMVEGMATLVVYTDESVDVIEWTDDIPLRMVKDARQLRHLIVKDGKVVERIAKRDKIEDSEIGLGGFLVDNNGASTMRSQFWFLANRTAFGIRDDGNLVFAMGHHISTKDLAKALVLAGCKRAIHGDANIHNIVCNFYFRNEKDKVVRRDRLSPEQLKYTMSRYDTGYAKDFFAFYEK